MLPTGSIEAMSTHVSCTVTDGIAHVRLDRPDKLNALTLDILDDLVATAHALRRDKTLRAVVVSGEGDAFCAGLRSEEHTSELQSH